MFQKQREPGYGGVLIIPKMFVSEKEFVKELRKTLTPFLTNEEEVVIISRASRGGGVSIFLPTKEWHSISGRGSVPFTTFVAHARSENADQVCCRDWYIRGCCGGPRLGNVKDVSPEDLANPKGKLREDLSNYFIA